MTSRDNNVNVGVILPYLAALPNNMNADFILPELPVLPAEPTQIVVRRSDGSQYNATTLSDLVNGSRGELQWADDGRLLFVPPHVDQQIQMPPMGARDDEEDA